MCTLMSHGVVGCGALCRQVWVLRRSAVWSVLTAEQCQHHTAQWGGEAHGGSEVWVLRSAHTTVCVRARTRRDNI